MRPEDRSVGMSGKREDFSFTSPDGLAIACYRWPSAGRTTAAIQIAHGLGEHSIRYARAAGFLNRAGYVVYANDHRGHGRSAPDHESLGDFGERGWDGLVEDMVTLTGIIRAREGAIPIVLLGHSMGSFAAQQYLLDRSALIAGVVLSGSAAVDFLARPREGAVEGLESMNRDLPNPRTPFDWLSRDPAEVDKYIADPLCGFNMTPRARESSAASLGRATDPAQLARIRKDLPIYIFAGDADPLNNHLEHLRPVAKRYRAAGIRDVTERYYAGGRHEMLNETNRDEVLADLLAWLRRAIHS
jgi:alpha-beta hydrolase superfamily lysophospholipase